MPAEHRTVEMSFQLIGPKAGIRRIHPHLLRHTFATQSLLNGAPLPAVMRLGGWRTLNTVQRYTYMNDEVAAQVHAQTSPLRGCEEAAQEDRSRSAGDGRWVRLWERQQLDGSTRRIPEARSCLELSSYCNPTPFPAQ
jgi:hypothetical protein